MSKSYGRTKWAPAPGSRHWKLPPGEVTNAQLRREVEVAFEKLADRKPVYRRFLSGGFGRPSAAIKDSLPKTKAEKATAAAREFMAVPCRARGSMKIICRKYGAEYGCVAMRVRKARRELAAVIQMPTATHYQEQTG